MEVAPGRASRRMTDEEKAQDARHRAQGKLKFWIPRSLAQTVTKKHDRFKILQVYLAIYLQFTWKSRQGGQAGG